MKPKTKYQYWSDKHGCIYQQREDGLARCWYAHRQTWGALGFGWTVEELKKLNAKPATETEAKKSGVTIE